MGSPKIRGNLKHRAYKLINEPNLRFVLWRRSRFERGFERNFIRNYAYALDEKLVMSNSAYS